MKKMRFFILLAFFIFTTNTASFGADTLTCWFPPAWKNKASQAKAITNALATHSGLAIKPRIAGSYPDILSAFESDRQNIVYVGSFVQAILQARGLGKPLVQNVNGKEFYSGVMVYPSGRDPKEILKNMPEMIAFAKGASSGESSAKAATAGKANIATRNHSATCAAVKAGKAKAGVVKNWWWQANKGKFPSFEMYEIPEISLAKNPDNVLTVSNSVSEENSRKIAAAAIACQEAFGAPSMVAFNPEKLKFSIELMRRGKIDPLSYTW